MDPRNLTRPPAPPTPDLVALHRPLARGIAAGYARFTRGLATVDDLEAVALEAVWRASLRWTEGDFGSFAARAIRNAIVDEIRRLTHAPRHGHKPKWLAQFVALDAAQRKAPGPDAERLLSDAEESRALRVAIDELPEREALVLRRRFFCDETQSEIAASLGVTAPRINQLEKRGRSRLKQLLKEEK